MKNKQVLLSGYVGGVGIHVMSEILANTNWEIIGLDSFRHKGYKDRFERVIEDHPEWRSRVTEIQHDLVCPINPEMIKKIGEIDYILHLAAMSDVFYSIENPVYTIHNNITSTLMMLEYARQIKPEAFIYFGTDESYGPVLKGFAHKEWSTHRPSNPYSASKAACEDICYSYWRSYDVPIIITNTMNNFSTMQGSSKFPVIVQKKVEAGEVVTIHGNDKEIGTRFYIDSRDVGLALLRILEQGVYHHKTGELDEPLRYHIVGEKSFSNLELAQVIAKLMGKELKYEIIDFHHNQPSHDIHYGLEDNKLSKMGWEPAPVEERLKDVIEWQTNNKEWLG